MIKQYIIVRSDCPTIDGSSISPQKLAVQVSHASMAFLAHMIMEHKGVKVDSELKEWFDDCYTKIILRAKNLNEMNKVIRKAEENGFVENKDFFCIKDVCRTELLPDDGEQTCFTAIGFRPMDENKLTPVVKRLQLYK